MHSYFSTHDVKVIKARAGSTSGFPLQIKAIDDSGELCAEWTLYTGDEALSIKMAEAINAVAKEHRASKEKLVAAE